MAANRVPSVATGIANQVVSEDTLWSFQVPSNTFNDPDGDALIYGAGLDGGGELPSWLSFDINTLNFSGTPPQDWNGSLDLAVNASDGHASATDAFTLTVEPSNDAPVVSMPLADRDVVAGEDMQFRLPQDSFADIDGDTLTYSANLADGSALPAWLAFDTDSQIFSGTPPADGTESLAIIVTASDGESSASDSFLLSVKATNAAPVMANAIVDQIVAEDTSWTFSLPADTFADDDSIGLVFTASLAGKMPLPSWITFDPVTQTFSGTPPKNFNGELEIEVRVNDGSRLAADSFLLTVTPQPDAPIVAKALPNQMIQEDRLFSFELPADSFTDPDGDTLTLSATLSNDKALPSWLKFDAATETFSGTPPKNFDGDLAVKVTASDGEHTISDTFELDVMAVNDAPVLAKQIGDKHLVAGKAWSYEVADDTFTDVDSTNLSYKASLDTGKALPSWLKFDASTQTFTGTPPKDWHGPITVSLTASDGISSAAALFTVSGSAPFVENPIDDHVIGAGKAFKFVIPNDTFDDYDGSKLSFKATLSNGDALPSWLKFDAPTQVFSGTAPDSFNGELNVTVTASDGVSKASDTFAIAEGGEFQYHLQGTSWGVDQIHYRFDDLFFESSADYSLGVSGSDSWGPLYGGYSVGFGFDYNVQAGVLVELTLTSSKYDLTYSFNMDELVSKPVDTLNGNPYVVAVADIDDSTEITSMGDGADNTLRAFAGIAGGAHVYAGAEVYGGIETPWPFPNIEVSAGVGFNLGFDVPAATIDGNGVNFPDGFGAISVDLNGNDDPIGFDFGDGIGHIDLKLPGDMNGFSRTLIDAGASGLDTLTSTVYSDSIISASIDLDALLTKYVPQLIPLFNGDRGYSFINVGYENDFKLTGDLKLKEEFSFTPTVYATMTTSLGQTVSGKAGDKIVFDKPVAEGEGTFSVDAKYRTEGDLQTTVSLAGDLAFAIKLFALKFSVGVHAGPIDFDLYSTEYVPFMERLAILGGAIPLYTNTRHVVLDTVREHTFDVAYENFRTVEGSGDSFTATTHQISIDGNDQVNAFIGNTYGNIINSLGGNDNVKGLGGGDTINAGAGNDRIDGGNGNDTIDGGSGNDTINAGSDSNTVVGGGGNDQITAGSGNDIIDGGDGNDTVNAGAGFNSVVGGGGNDQITAGSGNDTIDGGDGNDTIDAGEGNNRVAGGDGDDDIVTGADDDTIDGGAGSDTIDAGEGNNIIIAGSGKNVVTAGDGNDTIYCGNVGDKIDAGGGNNSLIGGWGDDVIIGGAGNDTIRGGGGFDKLTGAAGNDIIIAGGGNDRIDGGGGNDILMGDIIGDGMLDPIEAGGRTGNADVFTFAKGSGHDTILDFTEPLRAENGTLTMVDKIDLTGYINIRSMEDLTFKVLGSDFGLIQRLMLSKDDWIDFAPNQRAQDFISARNVIFNTDPYIDPPRTVVGTVGSDSLAGRTNDDKIDGGGINDFGDDILDGREGNDVMNGRAGNDTLIGGAGAETMTGGDGADVFVYNAVSDSSAAHPDTITDFGNTTDQIDLSAMDWDPKTFGDQAFRIDNGDGVLSAGELVLTRSGTTIRISINADSDKAIDMVILLTHQQFDIPYYDLSF